MKRDYLTAAGGSLAVVILASVVACNSTNPPPGPTTPAPPSSSVTVPTSPPGTTPPTVPPTTVGPSPTPVPVSDYAHKMFEYVDQYHYSACGTHYTWSDLLAKAEADHNADMRARLYFGHGSNPDSTTIGEDIKNRIEATGYHGKAWSEIIAAGFHDPKNVADAWWASPGHHAAIVRCDLTQAGGNHLEAPETHWGSFSGISFGSPA